MEIAAVPSAVTVFTLLLFSDQIRHATLLSVKSFTFKSTSIFQTALHFRETSVACFGRDLLCSFLKGKPVFPLITQYVRVHVDLCLTVCVFIVKPYKVFFGFEIFTLHWKYLWPRYPVLPFRFWEQADEMAVYISSDVCDVFFSQALWMFSRLLLFIFKKGRESRRIAFEASYILCFFFFLSFLTTWICPFCLKISFSTQSSQRTGLTPVRLFWRAWHLTFATLVWH